MSAPPELVEFSLGDRAPVIDTMVRLNRDRDGWLNLQPNIDLEDVPDIGPSLTRMFTSRGPMVPLGSWVPGKSRRNGSVDPTSLGLQHPGGPRAMFRLRDAGLALPEGWKVLADHPKRGLVLSVPDGADPALTLDWLLRAAVELTSFDLPDAWHAGLFHSR